MSQGNRSDMNIPERLVFCPTCRHEELNALADPRCPTCGDEQRLCTVAYSALTGERIDTSKASSYGPDWLKLLVPPILQIRAGSPIVLEPKGEPPARGLNGSGG